MTQATHELPRPPEVEVDEVRDKSGLLRLWNGAGWTTCQEPRGPVRRYVRPHQVCAAAVRRARWGDWMMIRDLLEGCVVVVRTAELEYVLARRVGR